MKEASFFGSEKTIALLEICYNLEYTTVSFRFREELPVGTGHLKITFDGILNGDMAGFYKSSYSDADGRKQIMASTQFEALDARRAFPCWDEASSYTFEASSITSAAACSESNFWTYSDCAFGTYCAIQHAGNIDTPHRWRQEESGV